ncbi:hypothetical protein Q765_08825 [Flavobacterium rivuli WB 3.3-2 = DSM 21788]|uniref:Fibronectin type-III domain-containing protein n=1 Tax=Flavobacterium rivuli WB 3.3-2 = DSM 21788 TaxID=1121895 RepID=A0A0A2M5M4_9FLAO|nr:fibronectin type III domain-containing protein [Flavobacterium rivuli]KGO86723.1 hypothetical protein Q765_08825 [Flavobacterium rivuli WB 3.3-2 = DSM 21788]
MKKSTLEILQKQWRQPQQWIASFMMLFVLVGTNAFAQTVTLGSGTEVSVADSGSGLGPVNSYYAYMHYQVVYTAAEITAAGGATGTISQFGWNVATPSVVTLPNYKIRLAQTTATNSATHNNAALTEVYSGNYTSVGGYNMFTLTTPFVWDGTSNILVDVCYGEADFDDPYGQVFVYGTADDSSRFVVSDEDALCNEDTDTANDFKPQARFILTAPPSCFAPTGLTFSGSTSTTATVVWTAPSTAPSSGYQYYYSTNNTAPTATTEGTPVTTGTTATITGLTANTQYYVWVRSSCGENFSTWTPSITFTTPCEATGIPYSENFESATTPALPGCTTSQNVGNGNNWTTYSPAGNGFTSKVLNYTYNSNNPANAWFYTRGLNLTAGVSYRLTYKYGNNGGTTYVERLRVSYGTANIATSMTTELANHSNIVNNTTPITNTIDFTPSSTGVYYIGFNVYSITDRNRLFVDDITVDVSPSCLPPSAVQVSAIGKAAATLSWTAPGTVPSEGYQIYYSTSNVAPTAETVANATATGVTTGLSGLQPSTTYYVWVRGNCGTTNGTSVWAPVATFTTLCDYPEIVTANDATVCGEGPAQLTATATNSGLLYWYDAPVNGNFIGSGSPFASPSVNATRDFYVSATQIVSNSNVAVGAGATTSDTYSNPLYSNWSNNHTQHLITAQELRSAGITAGNLNSIALNVTSTSSIANTDLSIKIGTTTATQLTTFVSNNGLATVYTSATYQPTTGINTFAFTTPFNWDGTSNILVEFCHGNAASTATLSRTVKTDNTSYVSTVKFHVSDATSASAICGTTTGSNLESYSVRPQFTFNGNGVCQSPREAVTVTVTSAPAIEVAATAVSICEGQSTTLSVASDNDDYTYVWTPGTNLTGESQIVSPAETTTYTVTATDAVTGCVAVEQITVAVNTLPAAITVTPATPTVCPDAIVALTINGASANGAATVGTATTQTTDTEELTAFSNRRVNYKSQTIYTAAELIAAGLQPGSITSIAYNISSLGDAANNDSYTVKLGSTENAVFANTTYLSETGFTTVYGPATYTHAVGVNTITFTTPYVWDGVSNIVISVSHLGADNVNNAKTYYTDLGANTTLFNYNNLTSGSGTLSPKRFNVTFNYSFDTVVTWTPAAGLFTDEAATIAYTGQDIETVYAKLTQSATYTVSAANESGCSVTATAVITVAATQAPVADATQTFCGAGVIAGLMATGTDIKWYENATGGIALVDDVALVNGEIYYASQTANGCESETRTPVTVVLTTVLVDDPEDVTQCGGTYTLPALTNGNYYTENNGAGTMLEAGALIEETTTLYVFATSATTPNCTNQSIFTVTINNTPAPTGVSPQSFTVASATDATIEDIVVTATGTVRWYATESDAIAGVALPEGTQLVEGNTYYATQTIGNCTSTEVLAVTIEEILGGKGFDLASFSYYPNPVNNVLNLTYSSDITSVAIFNLLGQQVNEQKPNTTNAKVDTSMLAEGTYLVKVTAGNAVKTIKVIKKN